MPQFDLIVGFITAILLLLVLWRLVNPFRCQCGYITWSANRMLTHVEMKHVHKE
jgi:hypothetical protein